MSDHLNFRDIAEGSLHAEDQTSPPLRYDPVASDELRLLHLDPASDQDEDLVCRLSKHKRSDGPRYRAISYTWGDTNVTSTLFCDGQLVSVPLNSVAALRAVRHPTEPQILWIDAICINQIDLDERSSQVAQMGETYRLARETLAHLGSSTELLNEHSSIDSWEMLLQRPWFNRTWVIQETLLSRDLIFVIGTQRLQLNDLLRQCDARQLPLPPLLALRTEFVHEYGMRPPKSWEDDYDDSDDDVLAALKGSSRHSQQRRNAPPGSSSKWMPTQQDGPIEERVGTGHLDLNYWRLPTLLYKTRSFQCLDPRDKLYALLPLFSRPIPQLLTPDYSKSVRDVFTDLSWFCIRGEFPDSLTYSNGFLDAHDLPSWATDWRLRVPRATQADASRAGYQARSRELHVVRKESEVKLRGISVARVIECHPASYEFQLMLAVGSEVVEVDVQVLSLYSVSARQALVTHMKWDIKAPSLDKASHLHIVLQAEKCIGLMIIRYDTIIRDQRGGIWNNDTSFDSPEADLITMCDGRSANFIQDFLGQYFTSLESQGCLKCGPELLRRGVNILATIDVLKDQGQLVPFGLKAVNLDDHSILGFSRDLWDVGTGDEIVILLGFTKPFLMTHTNNKYRILSEVLAECAPNSGHQGIPSIMNGRLIDQLDWDTVWSEPCPAPLKDYWFF